MPINTIIYPVTDLEAAKAVFTAALGSGPTTDQPYYVGFEVGDRVDDRVDRLGGASRRVTAAGGGASYP